MLEVTKRELRTQQRLPDCVVYNVCFKFPILLSSVQNYKKPFKTIFYELHHRVALLSLRYKICPEHKVCLLKKVFSSSSLRCILTGLLGIKTALPDYKNCI